MRHKVSISIIIILSLLTTGLPTFAESSAYPLTLLVNGKNITGLSEPVIINDRVLVPIRFVAEEVGATVLWDGTQRTVTVKDGENTIKFWIDSRLVEYGYGIRYGISDVVPIIINDRAYIPVRMVSEALNISIEWNGTTRTVIVDSSKGGNLTSMYNASISNLANGETVKQAMTLMYKVPETTKKNAALVKLLLLDKVDAKGYVMAKKDSIDGSIYYNPRPEDDGNGVLVLAFYDSNGKFIDGQAIDSIQALDEKVSLQYTKGDNGSITMGQTMNFLPRHVNYELTNISSQKVTTISERDPSESYTWTPLHHENGSYKVRVVAVDGNGVEYTSHESIVSLNADRYLYLSGVSEGQTINKAVTLLANRNYDVYNTQYVLRDRDGSHEQIIADIPYGSFEWFPDSTYAGSKEIFTRVEATNGLIYESVPKNVTVDGTPRLFFSGVSPRQVITSKADLSVKSNVAIESLEYIVRNNATGNERVIASQSNTDSITYYLKNEDGNDITLYARAKYEGTYITSNSISLKGYHGETFGPKALIEKDKFMDFAKELALVSLEETGMSAALQTAQAIHETGWGQYVPVDKYSGKFSYNMFGIKGSASNGSVISNTWEVYNGKTVRIDDYFRAYNNVDEAWLDHKHILLDLSRYEPFRDVMYNSTEGAWAIRRCGYATDPIYPIKLIRIIEMYDLHLLDRVGLN